MLTNGGGPGGYRFYFPTGKGRMDTITGQFAKPLLSLGELLQHRDFLSTILPLIPSSLVSYHARKKWVPRGGAFLRSCLVGQSVLQKHSESHSKDECAARAFHAGRLLSDSTKKSDVKKSLERIWRGKWKIVTGKKAMRMNASQPVLSPWRRPLVALSEVAP